jgi:phosphoribosylanthranilate isomerase
MWVKICANTNLHDAKLAADAGADAVGFVFAPSPRQVTAEHVATITRELPEKIKKIGVFDSRNFTEIAKAVRIAGLTGVQLHGGLDLPLAERLRQEFGDELFLMQTLHWLVDGNPAKTEEKFRMELCAVVRQNAVDAVLLDAKTATVSGGTGKNFNWAHAAEVLKANAGSLEIIIAGGLNANNVAEAIRTLQPWGVDVASGTEASPGIKDPAKVKAFIASARAHN